MNLTSNRGGIELLPSDNDHIIDNTVAFNSEFGIELNSSWTKK